MADWVGTIVGLWDVAVRVATFANDLRSAQDDFVGLRAEAECLLICINALNSPSCLDTLYRYINKEQAKDLDVIVKNTELNMKDLNRFIAKCWRLVERDVGKKVKKKGWRGMGTKLKEKVAKAWARYKFTMTDKQAFRDKLILPTQSVNIYLTALTHVGLVNVKFLIEPNGDSRGGGGDRGKGGGRGGNGGNGGGQIGGGAIGQVGPLDGWRVKGRRVAFKDIMVRQSELTTDIEEEIVLYALHLMRGGTPFHANNHGGGSEHKVTKTTTTRTRSRSRSVGPLGLGKRNRSGMFLVRKKSVSKPSSERVEIVQREYRSGSDSEGPARNGLLALPAPDSSSPGIEYVKVKPRHDSSSSSSSDNDSGYGGRSPGPSTPPNQPPLSPFQAAGPRNAPHPEPTDHHRYNSEGPAREPDTNASGRAAWHAISRDGFNARRRNTQDIIQAEADAAVKELEENRNVSRMARRRSRLTHRTDGNVDHEQEEAEEKEDDMYELCNMLMEEYGVHVEPLPKNAREPIYGSKVRPAPPVAEEEAEHMTQQSHGRARHRSYSQRVLDDSENEASEREDEKLVESMSHNRSDRLKAETNTLGLATGFSRGSYEHSGPRRMNRRDYRNPHRSTRFDPYPMAPDIHEYRSRYRRPPYEPENHSDTWDSPGYDELIIEAPSSDRQHRRSQRPGYGHRRDSDDDSFDGLIPVSTPRGPGPGPPGDGEFFHQLERQEKEFREKEKLRTEEKKRREEKELDMRRTRYERPAVHIHRPSRYGEPREMRYQHDLRRSGSYGDPAAVVSDYHEPGSSVRRHRQSFELRSQPANMDVYMSGARHVDDEVSRRYGSEDSHSDGEDQRRIREML